MGKKEKSLARQLNLFDSTMVMVGIVIGSGIFLTTGIMAKSIPSAGLILLAWIAATCSVFTLRKKLPDLPRPYKTWGYPVVPIIFIAASAGILLNTLIEKPVESLAGLALTALGIPVYFYWKRKKDKK